VFLGADSRKYLKPLPSQNEIALLNKLGEFIETVLQLLTADPAYSTENTIHFGDISFSPASLLSHAPLGTVKYRASTSPI